MKAVASIYNEKKGVTELNQHPIITESLGYINLTLSIPR